MKDDVNGYLRRLQWGCDGAIDSHLVAQAEDIEALRFPKDHAGLPLPQRPDGTLDTSFQVTKPLVDLGRFLFGDPALVTRIVTSQENPFCSGEPSTAKQGSCVACRRSQRRIRVSAAVTAGRAVRNST
jgi:hypothetical protein